MVSSTSPLLPSMTLQLRHRPASEAVTTASTSSRFAAILYFSSASSLHRRFYMLSSNPNSWSIRCHPSSTGRRPESEPPSDKREPPSSGVGATLGRFQDSVQIFVAVLFWMSLFFWSSAWDGRNNGRSNKGPRFRK